MPMPKPCSARFPSRRPRSRLTLVTLAATVVVGTAVCGSNSTSPGRTDPLEPPSTRPAKWDLAWADEFNGAALDANTWIAVDGAANVNNELEYYTPSDVYLENGTLVLRSQARSMGGRGYTSGEVRTGTKRLVSRGSAVEWRTQIPSGKGIWPANWLVASACTGITGCGSSWPPEIDVLEVKGSQPNVNIMTHWWGSYPGQQHQTTTYDTGIDLSADFHTYRLEWFRDSILWYIDGTRSAKHTQSITSGSLQLVMNTAVGGDFDGAPNSGTVFPQYQRVDYVRVYRDTANAY
jgi:beta-glucanase (GH16 family)